MAKSQQPILFDRGPASHGSPVPRTFAEFFAGIGLARMGLERTGWKIRFANDMDSAKLEMYEGHFGPASYYSTADIHVLAKTPELVPNVVLAHASFPCTDLSVAGARRGLHAGQSSGLATPTSSSSALSSARVYESLGQDTSIPARDSTAAAT